MRKRSEPSRAHMIDRRSSGWVGGRSAAAAGTGCGQKEARHLSTPAHCDGISAARSPPTAAAAPWGTAQSAARLGGLRARFSRRQRTGSGEQQQQVGNTKFAPVHRRRRWFSGSLGAPPHAQHGPHGWSVTVSMTVTTRVSNAQSAKTPRTRPSCIMHKTALSERSTRGCRRRHGRWQHRYGRGEMFHKVGAGDGVVPAGDADLKSVSRTWRGEDVALRGKRRERQMSQAHRSDGTLQLDCGHAGKAASSSRQRLR